MDVCCLGNHVAPCYVLRLSGVTVLLDCGLDTSVLDFFQPQAAVQTPAAVGSNLKGNDCASTDSSRVTGPVHVRSPTLDFFDLSCVDALLLSNSSYLLALPYLLKSGKFRGRILATQPALQLGRLMMEELAQYVDATKTSKSSQDDDSSLKKLPFEAQEAIRTKEWQQVYSMEDIADAVQKIELVSYGQGVDLFGLLKVTAMSSGASLGSCNWMLQTPFDKIIYLSASSQLTTHPQAIQLGALNNADVMLVSGLSQAPSLNPDTMIGQICEGVGATLRSEGNVLFPVFPTGVIYDLLECLLTYFDNHALHKIPIFFISPVADASLAFANIYGEWSCTTKQNKLYVPEPPFAHAELIKNGRLQFFPHIHGAFNSAFRSPCIVFAGHPSLRFGDAVHFMKLWGSSPRNTVILTESEYANANTIRPFLPLEMKTLIKPIDTRLNFNQINRLMQDLKPSHVVTAESYLRPPPSQPSRTDLSLDRNLVRCTGVSSNEVVSLPLQSTYQRAMLSLELAEGLDFKECRPSVYAASLSACLMTENNQHNIIVPGCDDQWHGLSVTVKEKATASAADSSVGDGTSSHAPMEVTNGSGPHVNTRVCGKRAWTANPVINIDKLRESLAQRGYSQQVLKVSAGEHQLLLNQDQVTIATITLRDGSTQVTNNPSSNDEVLSHIRDAILDQVQLF